MQLKWFYYQRSGFGGSCQKGTVELAGFDAKENLIWSKKQKEKSYIFEKKEYSLTNNLMIAFKIKWQNLNIEAWYCDPLPASDLNM